MAPPTERQRAIVERRESGVGEPQRGIQWFHRNGPWTDRDSTSAERVYSCTTCGAVCARFDRDRGGTAALGDASKGKAAVRAHAIAEHGFGRQSMEAK